ncbi:hypothetical protein [Luteococcus sp.]|uniref:hypothetical protein n=1 Tax=Luteococcus sp. TaxID=1969402 RepID=UPI003735702C
MEEAPEVRVVSDVGGGFRVELEDLKLPGDNRLLETWSDDGAGVLTIPMAEQNLEAGRYRIVVLDGEHNVMTSRAMTLGSGDFVDESQWERVTPVGHVPDEPLAAVLADEGPRPDGDLVYGARALGQGGDLLPFALSPKPWWGGADRSSQSVGVFKAPEPDRQSCIYTGAHRQQIDAVPLDSRNRPLSKWTVGRCTGCGLERRYPTKLPKNRGTAARRETRINDVTVLPPVAVADAQPWDLIWDALGAVGGGSWGSLERLAFRIEPTALQVNLFARTLQTLGHIDLQLDPMTMRPQRWEIRPSTLTRCQDGWYLAGYWPPTLTDAVLEAAESVGAVTEQVQQKGAPSRWLIHALEESALRSAVDSIGDAVEWSDGWRDLAPLLPPLSTVVRGLRRARLPLTENRQIRRWDVNRTTWVRMKSMEGPGAYRVSRFTTEDYIRTEQDVKDGTVAISDVYLSKHIGAWIEGAPPYLAHDPRRGTLTVPLGGDLPGLYGRAVVMASGLAPNVVERRRLLQYHAVPAELAQHIAHLFTT